jgi:sarcosine oxidase/L-pipecolate oxidase
VAYAAAKAGRKTLLLEQHHFLHRRGSSHGESRIVRLTYPNTTYTQIMVRAVCSRPVAGGSTAGRS